MNILELIMALCLCLSFLYYAFFWQTHIVIQRCRIGGRRQFHIKSIKSVSISGIELYGHLGRQLEDLQTIIKDIVNKINVYQIDIDPSVPQDLQDNIDAFCQNLKELDIVLKCKHNRVNEQAISEAISEIFKDNEIILNRFIDFSKSLDKYVKANEGALFYTHSHQGTEIANHAPFADTNTDVQDPDDLP